MSDGSVVTALRKHGRRITHQRLRVLSALNEGAGHLTVALLTERVRAACPNIDPSTVYRTLASAEELGLVARFDQAGMDTEFEWIRKPHHHLVCRRCQRLLTIEVGSLRELASTIEAERGFVAELRHLSLRGICDGCRAAALAPRSLEESA